MFHVGQKVVCIKTHSESATKEGETYSIKSISFCCEEILDVGIKMPEGNVVATECVDCHKIRDGNAWWQDSKRFIPLSDWQEAEEAVRSLKLDLMVEKLDLEIK